MENEITDRINQIKIEIDPEDRENLRIAFKNAIIRSEISAWCNSFADILENMQKNNIKFNINDVFISSLDVIIHDEIRNVFYEVVNIMKSTNKDLPACFSAVPGDIFDRWFLSMLNYGFFVRDPIPFLRYFADKNNLFAYDYYSETAGNCYLSGLITKSKPISMFDKSK